MLVGLLIQVFLASDYTSHMGRLHPAHTYKGRERVVSSGKKNPPPSQNPRSLLHRSTTSAFNLRSRDERPARSVYLPGTETHWSRSSSNRAKARPGRIKRTSIIVPDSRST